MLKRAISRLWPALFLVAIFVGSALLFPQHGQNDSAQSEPQDDSSDHLAIWLTAIFTGGLFASTIALWASTRDAANAAKAAAEALPILERAYVFVHIVDTNFAQFTDDGVGGNKTGGELSLRFTLRNHGRTPAIVKNVRASLKPMRTKDDIVDAAIQAEERKIDGSDTVIETGKELAKPIAVTSPIDGWYAYFAGRRARLFGIVTYEDIFRNQWETEFSLRFEGEPDGVFELWPAESNRRT